MSTWIHVTPISNLHCSNQKILISGKARENLSSQSVSVQWYFKTLWKVLFIYKIWSASIVHHTYTAVSDGNQKRLTANICQPGKERSLFIRFPCLGVAPAGVWKQFHIMYVLWLCRSWKTYQERFFLESILMRVMRVCMPWKRDAYPQPVAKLLNNAALASATFTPQIESPLKAVNVSIRYKNFALVMHPVFIVHDGVAPRLHGDSQVAGKLDHHGAVREVGDPGLGGSCNKAQGRHPTQSATFPTPRQKLQTLAHWLVVREKGKIRATKACVIRMWVRRYMSERARRTHSECGTPSCPCWLPLSLLTTDDSSVNLATPASLLPALREVCSPHISILWQAFRSNKRLGCSSLPEAKQNQEARPFQIQLQILLAVKLSINLVALLPLLARKKDEVIWNWLRTICLRNVARTY